MVAVNSACWVGVRAARSAWSSASEKKPSVSPWVAVHARMQSRYSRIEGPSGVPSKTTRRLVDAVAGALTERGS